MWIRANFEHTKIWESESEQAEDRGVKEPERVKRGAKVATVSLDDYPPNSLMCSRSAESKDNEGQ